MKLIPILLALLGVAMVLWSLVRAWRIWRERGDHELEAAESEDMLRLAELAERRALLMQQIRYISFDTETGKMAVSDREAVVRRLERQLLAVSRDLDALRGSEEDEVSAAAEIDALVTRLEAEAEAEGWSELARRRREADVRTP